MKLFNSFIYENKNKNKNKNKNEDQNLTLIINGKNGVIKSVDENLKK